MITIGQHIQKVRLLNGLTQEQLAKKSGVTYASITKIESGSINNPTIGTVAKIAAALSVSIDELYVACTKKRDLANLVQQYKSLVDNSPEVVARFDSKLRHIYLNPAGVKFSGKSKDDLIGKTALESGFPREVAGPFQKALRQVFKTGTEGKLDIELKTPKGLFNFNIRLLPEFAQDNKIESVLSFARPHMMGPGKTKRTK